MMAARKIVELSNGNINVDIYSAKVIEISPIRSGVTKHGDDYRVANCTINDGTGEIKLALWNDNVDRVAIGNFVEIMSSHVTSFNGELQLNLEYNTPIIVFPEELVSQLLTEIDGVQSLDGEKLRKFREARQEEIKNEVKERKRRRDDEAEKLSMKWTPNVVEYGQPRKSSDWVTDPEVIRKAKMQSYENLIVEALSLGIVNPEHLDENSLRKVVKKRQNIEKKRIEFDRK